MLLSSSAEEEEELRRRGGGREMTSAEDELTAGTLAISPATLVKLRSGDLISTGAQSTEIKKVG